MQTPVSYFDWECIVICIMKYQFTEVNRFLFFSNSSFCRNGKAKREGMVVRRYLVCFGFNTSKIGHEDVLWQRLLDFLVFKAAYQLQVTKTADVSAALLLCHVTICTTPPPLSLHVHIIISPVRYSLAYCWALSCRVGHACTASLCRAPWRCSGGSCQLLQEHTVCLVWFAGFKVSCPLLTLFLHVFGFFFSNWFPSQVNSTSWISRKHPKIWCMNYFIVPVSCGACRWSSPNVSLCPSVNCPFSFPAFSVVLFYS